MLRLIGILTGSAIAIAVLIIALGVPEFSKQPKEAAGGGLPATATEDPVGGGLPATATEDPVGGGLPATATEDPVGGGLPATATEDPVGGGLPATATEAPVGGGLPATMQTEALIEDIFAEQPVYEEPLAPLELPEAAPAPDNWYAFWSPFRSELAANGFVSQLQETTGIDYRVVKVKTGVYEVAFSYSDDADIQDKLARISNATGLDMTGG